MPDTYTMSAGESRTWTFPDEDPSDLLIDATADNTTPRINVRGDGTIRNLGVRGNRDAGGQIINIKGVSNQFVLENCFLGGANEALLYAHPDNAGLIELRRVHGRNAETAFYLSPPQNPPGKAGAGDPGGDGANTQAVDCHLENIDQSGYKMAGGTTENCTARNVGRIFWGHWNQTTFRNCRAIAGGNEATCFKSGYGFHPAGEGDSVQTSVEGCTVQDNGVTRYSGPGEYARRDAEFVDSLDLQLPSVPMSATEAANGESTEPPVTGGPSPSEGGGIGDLALLGAVFYYLEKRDS